ncbi:Hypothetical_protein [Hexamita inflata]|uniref:Hypothetical_protein n=1 Tax=Hexamita inflata TaxID=28002 RepID=A0AA86PJJ4_9EUKA|nr:Hypothetical protein HINF_LOCUS24144 [Hexamita inflata]
MGCTVTVESTIPIQLGWFQAAIENDLPKVRDLKRTCLFSYYNGLCALHYSIIYNSPDVFLELLQDESLLLTSSKSFILNKNFNSHMNIFQLAITSDNYKLSKVILDYFLSLQEQHIATKFQSTFKWFKSNYQTNCAPLLHHELFAFENKSEMIQFKSFEPETTNKRTEEKHQNILVENSW